GHTYAFYSVARDNVNNLEPGKVLAEASTRIPDILDVSGQVKIVPGAFRFNKATGRYMQAVALTNIGSGTIPGWVSLVLDKLSSNASLFNKTGVTSATSPAGSPYINIKAGNLAPKASLTVLLEFTSTSPAITYATRVLAGPGSR